MKRILWFRRDLRVDDNLLLSYGGEVLPIFIFDRSLLCSLDPTDRRVSFMYKTLLDFKQDLQSLGLDLKVFYGDPFDVIEYLLRSDSFEEILASGDYNSYAKERDKAISHKLHFRYIHDTYIFKPHEVLKEDGSPYLVFTPFYKKARKILQTKERAKSQIAAHTLLAHSFETISGVGQDGKVEELPFAIESLGFEMQENRYRSPDLKLQSFLPKMKSYEQRRDFFAEDATSHLSLDLRFGTIGVREILRKVEAFEGSEAFIRQLCFRDFYASLLFYFPQIETHNYKYAFNGIEDTHKFEQFCKAETGVPIVDAGVQELLQFGTMHNRVRMIVASFFTKDLLLPWQWGERFFAKHLLDYDAASNILSWQWSAGTGVDPQPYFRVFNPYLQSKKFDKDAVYIKRYLPQLQELDAKFLHDESFLQATEIPNYPKPIVSHKEAAKHAIELFKQGM